MILKATLTCDEFKKGIVLRGIGDGVVVSLYEKKRHKQ